MVPVPIMHIVVCYVFILNKDKASNTNRAVPCRAARRIGESNQIGPAAAHRATPHPESNRIGCAALAC